MTSIRFYLCGEVIFALAARKVGKCKKSKMCKINPPTVPKAISDYIKLLSQLSCCAECHFTIICITNVRPGSLAATYAYLIAQVFSGRNFRDFGGLFSYSRKLLFHEIVFTGKFAKINSCERFLHTNLRMYRQN